MSEKCENCRKQIIKYVLLEVSEFQDSDDDPEGIKFENVTLCFDCWTYAKQNSRIFQVLSKKEI